MLTRRLLLSSLLPVLGAGTAFAQEEPPEKPPALFEGLFPTPTGTNGFEEIIRAGERLREAKAPYPNPGRNSLTVKRAYIADPACRAAFSLLRQGLRKPIIVAPSAQLPVFSRVYALMRSLGRLLGFHVHVSFADGEGAAILGDVLAFVRVADTFQSLDVVTGMTGGGLEQSVLMPLTRLRDSWTERDCLRLLTFAKNRANAPDPALTTVATERNRTQAYWERMRTKPDELEGQFAYLDENEDTEGTTKAEAFAEQLRVDSGVRARVWGEMADAITAYYDRAAVLLADPSKRLSLETPTAETNRFHEITLYLRDSLVLDARFMVRQVVENRLTNQLLATHAAIRRYRWENDRLPKTLDDLNLPVNIVTDPFTAKPLLYDPEPPGTNYKLASAGALLPDEDGKPDARERFALPRESPVPAKPTVEPK
ncbi:MAG: hypothetical protein H8F28_15375 [Fibrella sp.]|nr:hypothetical protein [Armatimonadota bacterium]